MNNNNNYTKDIIKQYQFINGVNIQPCDHIIDHDDSMND